MKNIKRLFFVTAIGIMISFVMTISSYANFADTYSFSASGMARGNAMTAVVKDWSSVYYNMSGLGKTGVVNRGGVVSSSEGSDSDVVFYNPYSPSGGESESKSVASAGPKKAAVGDVLTNQLAVSYLYAYPKFDIDRSAPSNPDFSQDAMRMDEDLEVGTVVIGLAFDLNHILKIPNFVSSARLGLGIGLMHDLYLAKVSDVDVRTHTFQRYGRKAERAVILAGVGFGVLDDLCGVGIGANIWITGVGALEVRDAQIGPETQRPKHEIKADLKPKMAPALGAYISPGKIVPLLEGLELGVNYRGEVYMEIDPIAGIAEVDLGGVELNVALSIFDFYTPHIITAGFAYTVPFMDSIIISGDLEYQMWSGHRISGAKEIYWEDTMGIEVPEFDDIIIPKVGASFRAFDWLNLLAGYYYQPTFVPDEANSGLFNFLDNDKHVASFGFELTIPSLIGFVNPIQINMGFQYQYLTERDVTKNHGSYINNLNLSSSNQEEYMQTKNPDYSYGGVNYSVTAEVILSI